MGASRYAVLAAAQLNPDAVSAPLDAEYLRLDPYLYQLLTAFDLSGNAAAIPPVGALYGYANQPPSLEAWIASVPTFMQQTGVTLEELSELLVAAYINPSYPTGADRTMFAALPLSYAELTQLAAAGFTNPSVDVQNALANAGIKLADVATWWSRNSDIGQLLVISTPTGCDVSKANLAHLQDQSPPTDPELTRLHTFIRLWRVLGWSISDVDRALAALAAPEMTDVIHGLARIRQLSDALSPASLQILFALWSQINTDGTDALYTQLFLNPALVPLDPAFAPVNGAVLTGTANISDHIPALIGALQVSASDLALIRADAGLSDPQSGHARSAEPGQCQRALPLRGAGATARHAGQRPDHAEDAGRARQRPFHEPGHHPGVRQARPERSSVPVQRRAARLPLRRNLEPADGAGAAANNTGRDRGRAAFRACPDRHADKRRPRIRRARSLITSSRNWCPPRSPTRSSR